MNKKIFSSKIIYTLIITSVILTFQVYLLASPSSIKSLLSGKSLVTSNVKNLQNRSENSGLLNNCWKLENSSEIIEFSIQKGNSKGLYGVYEDKKSKKPIIGGVLQLWSYNEKDLIGFKAYGSKLYNIFTISQEKHEIKLGIISDVSGRGKLTLGERYTLVDQTKW